MQKYTSALFYEKCSVRDIFTGFPCVSTSCLPDFLLPKIFSLNETVIATPIPPARSRKGRAMCSNPSSVTSSTQNLSNPVYVASRIISSFIPFSSNTPIQGIKVVSINVIKTLCCYIYCKWFNNIALNHESNCHTCTCPVVKQLSEL